MDGFEKAVELAKRELLLEKETLEFKLRRELSEAEWCEITKLIRRTPKLRVYEAWFLAKGL